MKKVKKCRMAREREIARLTNLLTEVLCLAFERAMNNIEALKRQGKGGK